MELNLTIFQRIINVKFNHYMVWNLNHQEEFENLF
jgi:hypothetical protein